MRKLILAALLLAATACVKAKDTDTPEEHFEDKIDVYADTTNRVVCYQYYTETDLFCVKVEPKP